MTSGVQNGGNIFNENVKINFEQFLECALSHSLMDQLIDNKSPEKKDTSIEKEDAEIKEKLALEESDNSNADILRDLKDN